MKKQKKVKETKGENVINIPHYLIQPFAGQPRSYFNLDALHKLADSIKSVGQLQPISVKEISGTQSGCRYEIIDGERRWRACEIANVETVRAVIKKVADEDEQYVVSVAMNFGKENHTVPEEITAVAKLMKMGKSQTEVGGILGQTQVWVSQRHRLSKLAMPILDLMGPGTKEFERLALVTAVQLANLPDDDLRLRTAKEISRKGMSVNEASVHINNIFKKRGITQRGRTRRPTEHFGAIRNFFGLAIHQRLEGLDMAKLEDAFRSVSQRERQNFLGLLERNMRTLSEFRIKAVSVAKKLHK